MSLWEYNQEIYNPEYDEIDHAGFVYRITNIFDGRKYIGRKRMHKKRTLPALKGKKRKRKIQSESDWRAYCSSCDELIKDIETLGKENFKFEIISFHDNFTELNYAEIVLQVTLNVLDARGENGERLYYNKNILSRYYPSELRFKERNLMFENYASMRENSIF